MKKIILLAGLVAGGVALSATAFANNWLLYLPAILAGSGGGTTQPPVTTESNKWLLFLPAILAGSQGGQPPVVTGSKFNDTGIVLDSTGAACTSSGEDCNYGRDSDPATNINDDGHAGFSFVQINDICVLDTVTGLAWEVKTAGNSGTTYTWANATAYAESFTGCGDVYTSCRLPTIKELLSIVSWGSIDNIDMSYFVNAAAATYLTGTEVANASSSPSVDVWGFDFDLGTTDSAIGKTSSGYRVRAVCIDPSI